MWSLEHSIAIPRTISADCGLIIRCSKYVSSPQLRPTGIPKIQVAFRTNHRRFYRISSSVSNSNAESHGEEESVHVLRVPDNWLDSSKASEESEWLRVNLHKWLDDEYCPEETNVDISKVAASSFYKSLAVEKQTDLGVILLKMARDLESISYQESFHGAFSAANAAVDLIIQRIEQD